jgi:hypothetical protein
MRVLLFAVFAVACLFIPGAVHADDATAQKTTTGADMISHAEWTDLLNQYVRPDDSGLNLFDYGGLQSNGPHRAQLDQYIDRIAALDVPALPDGEAFAALANLYNALTIRLIIENYPLKSITSIRPGLFSIGPWKKDLITLGGERVSLDDIEHGMLRKRFADPRVHYAVNCASIGCPNLQPFAWTAGTLDADLDTAARAYVNHPRGVSVRADGRLEVSKIYSWYKEDFGGTEEGILAHLAAYAAPDLAGQIRTSADIVSYRYDWSLNDAPAAE